MKYFPYFLVLFLATAWGAEKGGNEETKKEIILKTPTHNDFNLTRSLKKRVSVILFYRGTWCPYSVKALKEFRNRSENFFKRDIQVLAISPDIPLRLNKTASIHTLPFLLLSDSELRAAKLFQVDQVVDEETKKIIRNIGVFPHIEKDQKIRLPRLSVFLIGEKGKIRFSFVSSKPDEKIPFAKLEEIAAKVAFEASN